LRSNSTFSRYIEAEEKIQCKLYEKQQADMAKLADYVEVGLCTLNQVDS
jgi:hypothetical protein